MKVEKGILCYIDDDRGFRDAIFFGYDSLRSRRSNLRRARKYVSKMRHVDRVLRCYVAD